MAVAVFFLPASLCLSHSRDTAVYRPPGPSSYPPASTRAVSPPSAHTPSHVLRRVLCPRIHNACDLQSLLQKLLRGRRRAIASYAAADRHDESVAFAFSAGTSALVIRLAARRAVRGFVRRGHFWFSARCYEKSTRDGETSRISDFSSRNTKNNLVNHFGDPSDFSDGPRGIDMFIASVLRSCSEKISTVFIISRAAWYNVRRQSSSRRRFL